MTTYRDRVIGLLLSLAVNVPLAWWLIATSPGWLAGYVVGAVAFGLTPLVADWAAGVEYRLRNPEPDRSPALEKLP